jgi:hypothetical protein
MKGADGSTLLYYESPSATKAELVLGKMASMKEIALTQSMSDRFYTRAGFLLMKTDESHQSTTYEKLMKTIDYKLLKENADSFLKDKVKWSFILTEDEETYNKFIVKSNLPRIPVYPKNLKLKDLYRFFRYNIVYSDDMNQRYEENVKWVIDHCTIMFNHPQSEVYANMRHKTTVLFNKGSISDDKINHFNEASRHLFEINNIDEKYSVKDVLHLKANTPDIRERIRNSRRREQDEMYKREVANITPWCFLPQDEMIQRIKNFIPDHTIVN